MTFHSLPFLIFLPIVFYTYWALNKYSLWFQNLVLIAASYVFYGWWDWRFLSLIVVSSATDYYVGLQIHRAVSESRRRVFLGVSVAVNLGILGFFKYHGFFVESAAELLQQLGFQANPPSLQLILPVGISFYTFQTLSYTIDIYRRRLEPTTDPVAFFAFVGFFPQLVAGPIERARRFLPQFLSRRTFEIEKAKDGLRQIAWGLMKKVVIADSLSRIVDQVYSSYPDRSGPELVLGTVYFAIQIYCDFSGYSDIASGLARLFGFDLMRNFAYP